jgi:hypothetical protein
VSTLKLIKSQQNDPDTRENFNRIENFVREDSLLKSEFTFFEFNVSAPSPGPTEVKLYVRLSFVPRDILVTRHTGADFTFLYDKFTKDYIVISATGDCKIRAFVGAYSEGRVL